MAAKLKVDQLETVDGTGNVTLNNSVTMASGKTLPAASLTGSLPAGMGGKVLQVVNATYNTAVTSSSTTFADTGLTATITPTSTTSTIIVMVSQSACRVQGDAGLRLKLFRGATEIAYLEPKVGDSNDSSWANLGSVVSCHEDSPATTSATTYKTQMSSNNSTTVSCQTNSGYSSITLMEIAG